MYKIQIKETDGSWSDWEINFPNEYRAQNELDALEEGCRHDGFAESFRVVPQE